MFTISPMSAPLGHVASPSPEPAPDSQPLSSDQDRADQAGAPYEGLAMHSLPTTVSGSAPVQNPAHLDEHHRCLANSLARAGSRPMPIPARTDDQPESQSGSYADAPLSLSPGTLRIASLSLVTPPSELVTRDMLGAAAGGVAVPRDNPTVAGASGARSGAADVVRNPSSDALRAVAKGAASLRALNMLSKRNSAGADVESNKVGAAGQGVAPPAGGGDKPSTRGDMQVEPGGGPGVLAYQQPVPVVAEGAARSPSAGSDAADTEVAKVAEHLGAVRPSGLGADVPAVDAGLLSSFMEAGPRCSLEEVTAATHATSIICAGYYLLRHGLVPKTGLQQEQ